MTQQYSNVVYILYVLGWEIGGSNALPTVKLGAPCPPSSAAYEVGDERRRSGERGWQALT